MDFSLDIAATGPHVPHESRRPGSRCLYAGRRLGSQAVRLQEALDEAAVSNVLVTIPGGVHVRFKEEEITRIYALIRDLLIRNDLMPAGQRPGGVTD